MTPYDILIAGGGMAGLSAALYAARGGKRTILLEKKLVGGQILPSPQVENYPGISKISGADLITSLETQAKGSGAEIHFGEVVEIGKKDALFSVRLQSGETLLATSVIVATGAKPRELGLPGEKEKTGSGISYCAYCDGNFYRNRRVAVIGGGDSAIENAQYLSRLCSEVFLIHRREKFRGNPAAVQQLENCSNVKILRGCRVTALLGEKQLEGIEVTGADGRCEALTVDGMFVAVGQIPDTRLLRWGCTLDSHGYAVCGADGETRVPGLFAAGDCRAKSLRQLVTAASDGAASAAAAMQYLTATAPLF